MQLQITFSLRSPRCHAELFRGSAAIISIAVFYLKACLFFFIKLWVKVLHVKKPQAFQDHKDTTQRLSVVLLWICSLILYTRRQDAVKGIYCTLSVMHVILTKFVEIHL